MLLLVSLCGCQRRPSAPDLRDSKVYHSREEGFRFLVPDGWIQTASAVLPPGELQGESFLVKYRINTPEPVRLLQVECMADKPDLDLGKHHAGPSYRVEKWTPSGPSQELQIHDSPRPTLGVLGQRRRSADDQGSRLFSPQGRLYSFAGLFWSTDDKGRQQIRRAVESTIWDR